VSYLVCIERARLDEGDIPRVCIMTGARDDVELVEVSLSASGDPTWSWSWLSMRPTVEVETVSTKISLPMCHAAARSFRRFRATRMAMIVAITCAAALFYVTLAGDLFNRSKQVWQMTAVLLGPLAPFALVALFGVLVRPRVEPVLADSYGGWVKLLIPSEQAATAIDAWMSRRPPEGA
jgi:hypothetical protein